MSEEHCPRKMSPPWAVSSQAKSKFTLWPAVPDVRFQDTGCVRTDNTVVCQQVFWAYQSIQKLCCLLSISLHGWQHCLYAQKMQNISGTLVNDLKQGTHINRGRIKAIQCDRMDWTHSMMVPPQRTLLCTLRFSCTHDSEKCCKWSLSYIAWKSKRLFGYFRTPPMFEQGWSTNTETFVVLTLIDSYVVWACPKKKGACENIGGTQPQVKMSLIHIILFTLGGKYPRVTLPSAAKVLK